MAARVRLKQTAIFTIILLALIGCKSDGDKARSEHSASAPTPYPTPIARISSTRWKTVEEFDCVWNPKLGLVHFKLELPESYDNPGDFTRVYIQAKGQPEFVLDNQDGWVKYNTKEEPSKIYADLQKQNLVASEYVLVLSASTGQADPPLVFLRSWGYASNAERLHVIGFGPSGKPIVLFNNEFALADLHDLDGDGYPELVGFPCMPEAVGRESGDMATYVPYQVYKIHHPATQPAALSIPLTKKYTTQKYDGWAGPQCSHAFVVVAPKDKSKKPRVLTKEQAGKL